MKNTLKETLAKELARALAHLYDPGVLQHSLLLPLFSLGRDSNPILALQDILTRAIEAQKPSENIPPGSNAWQIYHVLHDRYVEQFMQHQVANDLALSVRQLRRKEKTALQVLADHLWYRYNLDERSDPLASFVEPSLQEIEPESSAEPNSLGKEQELEWLQKTLPSESVHIHTLIEGVTETIRPMARTSGVSVTCNIPENCPPLNVQLATARQVLINVITTAVCFTAQGQVRIDAKVLTERVCIRIQSTAQRGRASPVDTKRLNDLEFARRLLQMSRGSLEITIDPGSSTPFTANVVLPTVRQIPILVIDDNPDLLALVQRYLSDTRYEFHGTSDSQAALALAVQLTPEIVLLDVIMPGFDGWELVGQLREHPKTRHSSIIICTILPQRQLALTLGAGDFIRKPIRRNELLAVLDRQMEQLSREASPSA